MSLSDIANIFFVLSAYKYLTIGIDPSQLLLILGSFVSGALVGYISVIIQGWHNIEDLINKTVRELRSQTSYNIRVLRNRNYNLGLREEAYERAVTSVSAFFPGNVRDDLSDAYIKIQDFNIFIRGTPTYTGTPDVEAGKTRRSLIRLQRRLNRLKKVRGLSHERVLRNE